MIFNSTTIYFFNSSFHQASRHIGETPLHAAIEEGHTEVVRLLIETGADKNQATPDDDETPLHLAARKGHLEIVRVLVEAGADKSAAACDGETPVCVAAQEGHLEVVRFLLGVGAERNERAIIWISSEHDRLEIVRWLRSRKRSRADAELSE